MRKLSLILLAAMAAVGAPAWGAPFAVLYAEDDNIAAVDLATVETTGSLARYEVVTVQRAPAELAGLELPDEMRHWKETDCAGDRSRLVRMAIRTAGGALETPAWAQGEGEWTGIDPREQRLVCEKARARTRYANLDELRAALGLPSAD
ncbi:hypothetical protein ACFODL_04575 [Phenylobacterium terrae]|uniref:Nuclease n=1 Tax=Phenylobacterium terrae TaxID=2665495 RepID=A0ABW4MYF5_9CAUL